MKGADEFIATIDAREREFAADLFAAKIGDAGDAVLAKALARLPS
jgi:Zn-dependent protease with chaperone function